MCNVTENTQEVFYNAQVCGSPTVIAEGIKLLRPGGLYVLVGLVHPNSQLSITGEQIIRKCITIRGTPNNEKNINRIIILLILTVCEI